MSYRSLLYWCQFILAINACAKPPDCWDIDTIEIYLKGNYLNESNAFIRNDTINIFLYVNDVHNSGEIDILREEILFDAYSLNEDKSTCFNNIFFGAKSVDKSLTWTYENSKYDLYDIIFRNWYYPELHRLNLYFLDEVESGLLNQYDTAVKSLSDHFSWNDTLPKPQSFTRLSTLYCMQRIKGIENGIYEQIIRSLKNNELNRSTIDYVLNYGKNLQVRFPEGAGIPWPAWNENDDYIKQIQEFKKEVKKLE